jgi:hypothetical protein
MSDFRVSRSSSPLLLWLTGTAIVRGLDQPPS